MKSEETQAMCERSLWITISTALALAVILTASCAPVISQQTLDRVDADIRFEDLLKDPEAYTGRTLLLGGRIIETENYPQKTLIILLQIPLGFGGRPGFEGDSKGRFILSVPGFLDPEIYRRGRRITVAGRVAGKEVRRLDEIQYVYPLIQQEELYLWPAGGVDGETRFRIGFGVGGSF